MVKIEIVFDESLIREIQMIFKQSGIQHYTSLENVKGVGSSGSKFGTAAAPGRNGMFITVVADDQKQALLRSIRKFKETTPNSGTKVIITKLEDFV